MKRLKLTKVIAITLVAASVLALNPIGASAEWKRDSSYRWWYTEGNSWATGWRNINGKYYYFNPTNGYMLHDTTVDGCFVNSLGEWIDDSNFNIKASKAEELIKQKYYSSSTNIYTRCCDFDGVEWVVKAYKDNEINIGSYCVNKNQGFIVRIY